MHAYLDDVTREIPEVLDVRRLVGLAGTVSAMAAVEIGLPAYDRDRIHHFVLTHAAAEDVFRTLALESRAQRVHNPGLEEARADVIVGGAAILVSIMRHWEFTECLVSESDILDGLVASLITQVIAPFGSLRKWPVTGPQPDVSFVDQPGIHHRRQGQGQAVPFLDWGGVMDLSEFTDTLAHMTADEIHVGRGRPRAPPRDPRRRRRLVGSHHRHRAHAQGHAPHPGRRHGRARRVPCGPARRDHPRRLAARRRGHRGRPRRRRGRPGLAACADDDHALQVLLTSWTTPRRLRRLTPYPDGHCVAGRVRHRWAATGSGSRRLMR